MPSAIQTQGNYGLSNGNLPGSNPLAIGGVPFNSIECPESLNLGSVEQKVAVIELIGGGREVQSIGQQPLPVSWSGKLWGNAVLARAKQLRQFCVNGQEVIVVWMSESWYAIVKEFEINYEMQFKASYKISLEITRDNNGALTVQAIPTVDSQVNNLTANGSSTLANIVAQNEAGQAVNNAFFAANAAALVPVQQAWATYVSALGVVASISSSTPAQLAPVLSGIRSVVNALGVYATVVGYSAGVGSLLPGYSNYTSLSTMSNLLEKNIVTGQAPQQLTVQGGSLYTIAATQYGDITQASSIAQANGIITPRLPNSVVQSVNLPLQQVIA